jgi:PAS domain S-box-containing protein
MVVVDQRGEIVLLNAQTEKQFGYNRDELVGQPVKNIIPVSFAERIIADDLRSAADAVAQVIGTGIELVALRKDGTEFPIEIVPGRSRAPRASSSRRRSAASACASWPREICLVAEGIETRQGLETLPSRAIHYGQGYFLGRPQDGQGSGRWPTVITPRTIPAKRPRSRRQR